MRSAVGGRRLAFLIRRLRRVLFPDQFRPLGLRDNPPTSAVRRTSTKALPRMQQRTTPEVMRLRAATVELPFAALKYRIFGHPRFLLRGLAGAQTEISLATLIYNLKRMLNVLGGCQLRDALSA
jgi:hypothetical protein